MVSSMIVWPAGFSSLERFELGFSSEAAERTGHTSMEMGSEAIYQKETWVSSCVTLRNIWLFGTKVV